MQALKRKKVTLEEYLAIEEAAEYKSEFYRGEMFAMSGGRPPHNLVSGNLIGTLRNELRAKGCRVYTSDQRVRIEATGLYTYPDVSVVCAAPRFDPADEISLLNPILLVEVLSDSTEAYDRGAKFEHYQEIDSLQEYLLVTPTRPRVECFTRSPDGRTWTYQEIRDPEGVLTLASVGCTLPLSEVYALVDLPPTEILCLHPDPEPDA